MDNMTFSQAAHTIRQAAETMSDTAISTHETLMRHQQFMSEWMQRLEAAMAPKPSVEETRAVGACPRCGRMSLERALTSGREYCLYSGSCGWSSDVPLRRD